MRRPHSALYKLRTRQKLLRWLKVRTTTAGIQTAASQSLQIRMAVDQSNTAEPLSSILSTAKTATRALEIRYSMTPFGSTRTVLSQPKNEDTPYNLYYCYATTCAINRTGDELCPRKVPGRNGSRVHPKGTNSPAENGSSYIPPGTSLHTDG